MTTLHFLARIAMTAGVAAAATVATDAFGASPEVVDATPAQCRVPEDTAFIDGPLPRLARRVRATGPTTVVVVGSGSSAGNGTSRPDAAYPSRLEMRLARAWPASRVRVVVVARTGQTAAAARERFSQEVLPLGPALVVWQTGSADGARGVDVADYGASLARGIEELHDAGADVVLMDGQYSPRASLIVDTERYREAVRWLARRYDLPLVKRYEAMSWWSTNDVFDLDAEDPARQKSNADGIHDCVAALLARAVVRGVAAGTRP